MRKSIKQYFKSQQFITLLILILITMNQGLQFASAGAYYPPNKKLGGLWLFKEQKCIPRVASTLSERMSRAMKPVAPFQGERDFFVISKEANSILQFNRYGALRMSGDLLLGSGGSSIQFRAHDEGAQKSNPIQLGAVLKIKEINTYWLELETKAPAVCDGVLQIIFTRSDNANILPAKAKKI